MKTNFKTERLFLDIITEEDHNFIQELVNTEGWLRFIGDRTIHSKEAAIAYINKINGTRNFYYRVVRLKKNGQTYRNYYLHKTGLSYPI